MGATHLILCCEDVDAGASFYRDVLAMPVRQRDGRRVEVDLGPVTATLTPASASSAPDRGLILEIRVPDVCEAVHEVRRRGAKVLLDPVVTDWGTRSAFVEGPDGVVVELYESRTH